MNWATTASAIGSAFLASFVEVVEAFTIVLAASTVRGWKPALAGTLAGLALLVVLVLALGPLILSVPLQSLQLVVGVLLLLFGMRWLRKAILRSAGIIPLHDEEHAFAEQTGRLRAEAVHAERRATYLAGATAFKGVVLEGIEVVFIVLAVGAGRGLVGAASLGAALACAVVLLAGAVLRKPLSRVPENAMKLAVGVMLSSFGVFFAGEGLGAAWPGEDLSLLGLVLLFALVALGTARLAEPKKSSAGAIVQ
ncbi:MAG: TMEM165/GDT1 family protein [Methylobacteriaceae bacterium]|nr:TMEM165/GDT1 family protein [Methylobacteriaceae bacterium]MBV9701454.1 TMEM165/GDT1 family protein [Methylobacteriaceae bacterium]